jgi:hypothetical protein
MARPIAGVNGFLGFRRSVTAAPVPALFVQVLGCACLAFLLIRSFSPWRINKTNGILSPDKDCV